MLLRAYYVACVHCNAFAHYCRQRAKFREERDRRALAVSPRRDGVVIFLPLRQDASVYALFAAPTRHDASIFFFLSRRHNVAAAASSPSSPSACPHTAAASIRHTVAIVITPAMLLMFQLLFTPLVYVDV